MNYGTLIDNRLNPAPRAFMLHGAMVTNPKAEHFAAWNEERAKAGLPPDLAALRALQRLAGETNEVTVITEGN